MKTNYNFLYIILNTVGLSRCLDGRNSIILEVSQPEQQWNWDGQNLQRLTRFQNVGQLIAGGLLQMCFHHQVLSIELRRDVVRATSVKHDAPAAQHSGCI